MADHSGELLVVFSEWLCRQVLNDALILLCIMRPAVDVEWKMAGQCARLCRWCAKSLQFLRRLGFARTMGLFDASEWLTPQSSRWQANTRILMARTSWRIVDYVEPENGTTWEEMLLFSAGTEQQEDYSWLGDFAAYAPTVVRPWPGREILIAAPHARLDLLFPYSCQLHDDEESASSADDL